MIDSLVGRLKQVQRPVKEMDDRDLVDSLLQEAFSTGRQLVDRVSTFEIEDTLEERGRALRTEILRRMGEAK